MPKRQWERIKPAKTDIRIRVTDNQRVTIVVTVDLSVEVRSKVVHVNLYVVERLETIIILGCHLFVAHIEEIRSKRRIVDLQYGETFPIVRNAVTRSRNNVSFPEPYVYAK